MKGKNLDFNKKDNHNSNESQKIESSNSSQDKNIIKKLMSQYNLSEDEAVQVLKKIEIKMKNKKSEESKNNPKKNQAHKKDSDKDVDKIENENLSDNSKMQDTIEDESSNQQKLDDENNDVDDILGDIIPDYNKHLSIKVENIDLTFNISSERVDTVKESAIRFLKRDNPPKLSIHAINDISFEIYKGEKIGIIGFNGAGKSTLLKVICGIYKPDKGKVTTYGNISPLLGLGAGFDINYSGRRNIFFNGAVLGYSKSFLMEKEEEIIEFSELGEYIDIPVKNYSSGMIAKLGFSIATIVDPDILIIDEILGVGDATFTKKSRDKMKSLMDGGTTVLLVSHSIPTIRQVCDKAIWIENGKLKEMGEVNKVCNKYLKAAEKATRQQLENIQLR